MCGRYTWRPHAPAAKALEIRGDIQTQLRRCCKASLVTRNQENTLQQWGQGGGLSWRDHFQQKTIRLWYPTFSDQCSRGPRDLLVQIFPNPCRHIRLETFLIKMINEVVIGAPTQIQSNPLVVICSEDILPLRSLLQYKYHHLLSGRGINFFPPFCFGKGRLETFRIFAHATNSRADPGP